MIIRKLVLNNFRVFQGKHEIKLTPNIEDHKPIVLFGGLNGSGKTSILTAIRLALYGKMAFEKTLQNQDYIEQLSALIFKDSVTKKIEKNASIELSFTYNQAGTDSEFTIIRSWQLDHKDHLLLLQNGKPLEELSYEQCQGFLNELIPHGVADLFFFDGEKIAALAEDESGTILQTAVRRLLGLDLIEKLRNDLVIYLKRSNTKNTDIQLQKQLNTLEKEKNEYLQLVEKYRVDADFVKARIDLITDEINKQERSLSAQGGAFALTKKQETEKATNLVKEKEILEKSIRQEFEGTFPLSLAPKILTKLLEQLQLETQVKQTMSFTKELNTFLDKLKKDMAFRSSSTFQIASEAIEDLLVDYLKNKPTTDILFDISERELGRYQQLIITESKKAQFRFQENQQRLAEVEVSLEQASINIQRAPDDAQLFNIFSTIREFDKERQKQIYEYKNLLVQAKKILAMALDNARKIQKLHESARSQYTIDNAVTHAQKMVNLLDQYSVSLTESRVKVLEANFINAYKRLNRKEHENLSVKISLETFDVELINDQGQAINRKSLSAGEKQIYAIAILEALGKTSGRQLPVIIDTPLGRLDSLHRDKLVKYYFPLASEQVIILSTDTEIDEHYFLDYLKDDISHSYQIKFDNKTHSSQISNGYFWQEYRKKKEVH